jgi:hypothetical protein
VGLVPEPRFHQEWSSARDRERKAVALLSGHIHVQSGKTTVVIQEIGTFSVVFGFLQQRSRSFMSFARTGTERPKLGQRFWNIIGICDRCDEPRLWRGIA